MIYLVTGQKDLFESDTRYGFASVQDVLDYFENKEEFEFDTETTGFDPHTCKILSAQFGNADNQYVVDCTTISLKLFASLFTDKVAIMQNAKFDLKFLYKQDIVPWRVWDTYLAECVLNQGIKSSRKGLDYLVWKYCKQNMDKTVRGSIHKEGLSTRVIIYAATDVKYLGEIKRKQLESVKQLKLERALFLDNEFVRVLAYIEYCGFYLDASKWKTKMQIDLEKYQNAKKVLDDFVLSTEQGTSFVFIDNQLDMFNADANKPQCNILWSSSKQVVEYFKHLGIDTKVKDSNTGGTKDSVEAGVIKPQKEKFAIIQPYLKYKEMEKVVSTYGESFLRQINPVTNRIHTNYRQILDTGRLSSGGKNRATKEEYINMQNIPSDKPTRSCFTACSGNKLIVSDYSGQESVVLVNKSLEPKLIKFYREGLGDLHSYVASLCFKEELSDVKLENIKKERPDLRQKAKSANFALAYGGTGITIAQNLSIPIEEGNAVEEAYFKAFSGLKQYFDSCKKQALRDGYVLLNGITGRKSFLDFYEDYMQLHKEVSAAGYWTTYRKEKDKDSSKFHNELKPTVRKYFRYKGMIERKAMNFPIQGTSADITKLAGVYFFRYLEENNLIGSVLICNVIHDEYVVECPEDIAEDIASNLKRCMEEAGDKFCKTIELKADPCITEHWTH